MELLLTLTLIVSIVSLLSVALVYQRLENFEARLFAQTVHFEPLQDKPFDPIPKDVIDQLTREELLN